jgi:hypothetical protein
METETDFIVRELCDWLKENDFDIESNKNLKLINSENKCEGRCVLAERNTEFNTRLVEIPFKFMINYRYSFKDQNLLNFFEWYYDKLISNQENDVKVKLTRLDALYFILIISKYDTSSFLNKFVKSMPILYNTPEYFSEDLVDQLPDYLKSDILARLNRLKAKFSAIKNLLDDYHSTFYIDTKRKCLNYTTIIILIDNFTYENFKWAFCATNSRCFHVEEADLCDVNELKVANKYFEHLATNYEDEDCYFDNCSNLKDFNLRSEFKTHTLNSLCCVVPYLDFLNHSYQSNSFAEFDKTSKSYVLKTKLSEEEEWFSDKEFAIEKGQQVYITYGHHDNKTLLIEYGFIINKNIYDRIIFKLEDFEVFVQNKSKLNLLWKKVIKEKMFNDLCINKTDGPSWNLLRLLDLIYFLNQENFQDEQEFEDYETYDIIFSAEIRSDLTQLLTFFEENLKISQQNLSNFKAKSQNNYNSYHFDMCENLTKVYLEILCYNLELVNDDQKWVNLF